jgi:hypothetical protein
MKINYSDYLDEALELFLNDPELQDNRAAVAKYLHHKHSLLEDVTLASFTRQMSVLISRRIADREIITENVKIAKQKQKQQDTNRIERKSFRNYARLDNAVEEYTKELTEQHKEYGEFLKTLNIQPLKRSLTRSGVGVIQITDLHGNELIDLPHNKYDFKILSKRLKLYINECLNDFKSHNLEKIAILFTGDLLNSDRRLDEMLNQATNRSKASLLMQHLLTQVILEVRNFGLPITIVSVLGNESRMQKEMTFSKKGLSDNYDFNIVACIKEKFEFANIQGITFGSIDKVEEVITIDGLNILVAHDLSKYTDKQHKSQATIGRYSLQGVKIDYMLAGHIHATRITDTTARSSSMSGSNSYNEIALNLAGKAQHNYFIVKDKKIKPVVVDLQDVEGIEGYSVIEKLEEYNTKSVDKLHKKETIFKIVI